MKKDNRRLERAGWVLFTLCAIFYIAANIRVGDWLSLLGSIFFLLACLVFFLTLNNGGKQDDADANADADAHRR